MGKTASIQKLGDKKESRRYRNKKKMEFRTGEKKVGIFIMIPVNGTAGNKNLAFRGFMERSEKK